MAYVTGTANSLSDLLSAVQGACTSNGWTLSGDVLHKGTCYVEVAISGSVITIRSGTGIDGSHNLTGACNTATANFAFGGYVYGSPYTSFVFPCTYAVHILGAPDEVYVIANFATSFYETIGFGQSAMPGLGGSGNWYSGGAGGRGGPYFEDGEGSRSGWGGTHSLFCAASDHQRSGVHHAMDDATWTVEGAWRDWASMFFREPNQWNQESILIPIRVYASRPNGFVSPVLECAHARYVNIADLQDQQVITLGTDRWKIYPWWHRGDAIYLSGGGTDTGVAGHAIRYDGP